MAYSSKNKQTINMKTFKLYQLDSTGGILNNSREWNK